MQQAAQGTELEPHLVGELIASEVEVRTGRCDTFAECVEYLGERRVQLRTLVDSLGMGLSSVGTHPWSPWQEQRIIDTPHYRRNNDVLRYVVWRNNTFGLHVHVGINGADRAVRVNSAMRNYLPELLAVSASSPFVEGVFTYLHSARTQVFTRMFPRCGIPDWFEGWDDWEQYVRFLYETGSVNEHTQLWWSVRPHLQFPTIETRICDAQPELAEARSLAALIYSLTARIARALDEGEPLPGEYKELLIKMLRHEGERAGNKSFLGFMATCLDIAEALFPTAEAKLLKAEYLAEELKHAIMFHRIAVGLQHDFAKVLVITHIPEMKEVFPARIEVRKTPRGSIFQLV